MQPYRVANFRDALFVAELLRRFYKRDGRVYGIGYDHASCLESISEVLDRGVCVVGQKSCAGAFLVPWPFNRSILVAQVFFWSFEDTKEIHIFDYLTDQCSARGATFINVASLAPKHAGKHFYDKRGLKLVEDHFLGPIKSLR